MQSIPLWFAAEGMETEMFIKLKLCDCIFVCIKLHGVLKEFLNQYEIYII